METNWVIPILLALLVGAMLPVLFQLHATLRAARKQIDRLGPKIDGTLSEVRAATQQVNQELEQMRSVLTTAREVADLVKQLRGSLRAAAAVGSAIGPAIVAAVHALTDEEADPEAAGRRGDDSGVREPAVRRPRGPKGVAS